LIFDDFSENSASFPRNEFADHLIEWFRDQSRDLPWRNTDDPYAIWISEIMLQQTRVETVIPYYQAWMQRFPDVSTLAQASEEDVLTQWQGLGYYRRARFILRAAKMIEHDFGGSLPSTRKELKQLPGIGSYTSGAIAAFAFHEPEPAVDGNVLRVMARVFADDSDIAKASTRTSYEKAVVELIPPDRAALFNEALIELGATVCTPTSPSCLLCPVREFCESHRQGIQETLPIKKNRTKVRDEVRFAWLLNDETGQFLVGQRPSDALLGGLWEYPLLETEPKSAANGVMEAEELGSVRHIFSHIRRTIHLHQVQLEDSESAIISRIEEQYADIRWLSPGEEDSLPLSTMMQKMLRVVREAE
jgi:A/G-specific adenine glycosylase